METARNFVLDNAEISFTDYNEMRAFVKRRVQEVAELTGRAMRCWNRVCASLFLARCTRNLSARRCMPKRCTSRRRLLRTRWPEPG